MQTKTLLISAAAIFTTAAAENVATCSPPNISNHGCHSVSTSGVSGGASISGYFVFYHHPAVQISSLSGFTSDHNTSYNACKVGTCQAVQKCADFSDKNDDDAFVVSLYKAGTKASYPVWQCDGFPGVSQGSVNIGKESNSDILITYGYSGISG